MKKITHLGIALLYVAVVNAAIFAVAFTRAPHAYAQGECTAGNYPKTTSIVQNGNFSISPAAVYPAGDPGNDYTVPGFNYSDASFYGQMRNRGFNIYPNDSGPSNAFSVQSGTYNDGGGIYQLPFPGDPTYNIDATNTWLYTNGNMHNGAEYLNWEQDVSGLTPGTRYVFVAYISNTVEPPGFTSDPTIRLRIGGTSGMPDGTAIVGPLVLTEAATANATALNGWQRVAFSFVASGTTEKLKVTDSSSSLIGDDFAMTAIGLQVCVPVPDYSVALSHTGTLTAGTSYTQRVTVNNVSSTGTADNDTTVTITLPTGYRVNGGAAGSVPLTNNASSYSCTSNAASPQVLTCTSATIIPTSSSQFFEFAVTPGSGAGPGSVSAAVSIPLEDNTANNSATDSVSVTPDIQTSISVPSYNNKFVTLQIGVENNGTGYTTSPTTVITQTLPQGISVNNGNSGSVATGGTNGAEWSCTSNNSRPQVLTCIHSGEIANTDSANQSFTVRLVLGAGTTNATFSITGATDNDGNSSNNQSSITVSFNLSNTGNGARNNVVVGCALTGCAVGTAFMTRKRRSMYSAIRK